MTRFVILTLLCASLWAQEPICFTYDGEKTVPIACSQVPHRNEWRELPASKPSWASRHKKTVIIGGVLFGAGLGAFISKRVNNPSCHEYAPGKNGVNSACPKEVGQ